MKKIAAVVVIVLAIGLMTAHMHADSFALGRYRIEGAVIDLDFQHNAVIAKGNARMKSPDASVKSDSVRLDLTTGANKKYTVEKATATGNVVVHGTQLDPATNTSRVYDATCRNLVMAQGQNTAVLTGNAVVKVMDPQLEEPATLAGEKLIVYLKERRIIAERSLDNPAELSVTPKEKPKSQPSRK